MQLWNTLRHYLYRAKWHLVGYFKPRTAFPLHIDIETASECNLHCSFCPHDFGFKNKGIMDLGMAARAIAEARKNKVKSIKFNFRGEPALNKDLEHLVYLSKKDGAYKPAEVFMNTNGIPYTETRIQKLKANGLDKVKISMDGATKQTYEAIRKGDDPNRWKKLNRNIKLFQEYGHNIELQMTTTENNKHEVEAFKKKFPTLKVIVNKERQQLTERKHCPQPYRRMIVGWNGTVYGCCNNWLKEYPVGDFTKQSLKEIWNGDRMKQLRKHAKEYTGPCKNCDIREAWKR